MAGEQTRLYCCNCEIINGLFPCITVEEFTGKLADMKMR